MKLTRLLLLAGWFGVAVSTQLTAQEIAPKFTRVPEDGLQPQALLDSNGNTHLVYFKGDAKAGDLFYVHRSAGSAEFSRPIRVNSLDGSAVALGSIRGAQIALGRNGRLHVAWDGSGKATGHPGAPMLYARLNEERTGFEPERDAMTFTGGLDGGGSIAADKDGNVYIAWHGNTPATAGKESGRAVYLAASTDEGRTFAPERSVNSDPTGACGCCGLKAFADSQGELFLLYRAARGGTERDEVLLASTDHGQNFRSLYAHPWKAMICPMSSAWIGPAAAHQTVAAWETNGKIWFRTFDPRDGKFPEPIAPAGGSQQKHPVAVVNATGQTLLVWDEGTGWQKGGALAWQVFDSNGKPLGTAGRKDGIPVWSFAAALARPDGGFEIFY